MGFFVLGGNRKAGIEPSTRERRRAMIQVELSPEDIDRLRGILASRLSELPMETA
jgi:hypothetical protein